MQTGKKEMRREERKKVGRKNGRKEEGNRWKRVEGRKWEVKKKETKEKDRRQHLNKTLFINPAVGQNGLWATLS